MAASSTQNTKVITMEGPSPLSFIFVGNEMVVQCTSYTDDQAAATKALENVYNNYRFFSDGKHAALIRRDGANGSTQYWITSNGFAEALAKNGFTIVTRTMENPAAKAPIAAKVVEHHKVAKVHIRRPRNQFIIYRQWMSGRIHAENPGVTAGCISQVVSQMWRAEKPEVKAHFKALADEEDRLHKMKYPGYRFEAGRRNPQPALRKRNLPHDPMTVAERLVAAGF